ncbi:DNA-formamidopyrimidine glycosylase [Synechococcus elongatus]|uniref:DNA-formamidopyrimidine glycosylase n=1 Tax=Synechococcus elongatus TaxID=32046 RepID=UPI000F7D6E84|nr:DNA-formamidopyrimidine glycosylase [Synechococcus elongatus]
MPELPEVETVRRGLTQQTLQRVCTGGEVLLSRTIATPTPEQFLVALQQTQIQEWRRRGKYLLADLSREGESAGTWGVHLRMTGQFFWTEPAMPLTKHTRVRLRFEGDRELRFIDIRSFGQMWWVPPDRPVESVITGLSKLGPEPFAPEFTARYLRDRLQRSQRPIKTALLDQSLVAGIGNIYADESLFRTGIHPTTPSDRLTKIQAEKLREAIVEVLTASIGAGGTTFSDFRDLTGVNGNYGGQAWVYGRNDQPCRTCGTPIQKLKLAGRSSHFCPRCQPCS